MGVESGRQLRRARRGHPAPEPMQGEEEQLPQVPRGLTGVAAGRAARQVRTGRAVFEPEPTGETVAGGQAMGQGRGEVHGPSDLINVGTGVLRRRAKSRRFTDDERGKFEAEVTRRTDPTGSKARDAEATERASLLAASVAHEAQQAAGASGVVRVVNPRSVPVGSAPAFQPTTSDQLA